MQILDWSGLYRNYHQNASKIMKLTSKKVGLSCYTPRGQVNRFWA